MAEPKNWFDKEFDGPFVSANGEQALAAAAKSPRLIKTVNDRLAEYDANRKKPGWVGPTRPQVVRSAMIEALEATD